MRQASQQLSPQLYQFQSLKIFYNKSTMLRRNLQLPLDQVILSQSRKEQDYSPSTQGSSCSPRDHPCNNQPQSSIRKDKEKSQLCKKFLEQGFCPYQKKCKFAHGSHQLRKNQQVNSKYKTKECGVFLSQGFCMYGERCNFIHQKVECGCKKEASDAGFQEVKAGGRLQSRLMGLLQLA